MPFDWRTSSDDLAERYSPTHRGYTLWREAIAALGSLSNANPAPYAQTITDRFLAASRTLPPAKSKTPQVFVSHQSKDTKLAERIAFLACTKGVDYWLDVHDPRLRVANKTIPRNHPAYPLIIALIIEMALLNCSHLIALHTQNSKSSTWVPYELGRAREHQVTSRRCAGWIHPLSKLNDHGEYVRLTRLARQGGEVEVGQWLHGWSAGGTPISWSTPVPRPLPF